MVEFLSTQGIVISAGHTMTRYEVIHQAAEIGVSRIAHLSKG